TFFFFFSSRRRHTRFSRDWSSDVCSSDLPITTQNGSTLLVLVGVDNPNDSPPTDNYGNTFVRAAPRINYTLWPGYGVSAWKATKIGRASCRERGERPAGAVALKKNERTSE